MRILFIQNRPLFPADTGGKIRTLNILRHLAQWHDVTYLCNAAPGDEEHLPKMRDLGLRIESIARPAVKWGTVGFYRQMAANLVSRVPFNVARHYDRRVRDAARALTASESFDLVICDFLQTALHADGLSGPKRVLFQHNVEAQILKRHAETAGSRLKRQYMGLQWRRMQRFEAETGRDFDAVVAVSDTDREVFERDYGWPHVRVIDTGVDVDYFRPTITPVHDGRVLFLGSMDWLPNQDGVQHFVRDIWPLIRQARPDATFQVVGRNPPPPIRALGEVPGVEVVGTVPDVRPYLAEGNCGCGSLAGRRRDPAEDLRGNGRGQSRGQFDRRVRGVAGNGRPALAGRGRTGRVRGCGHPVAWFAGRAGQPWRRGPAVSC